MPAFKDHFSGHAADYARFRPEYPDALFDLLTSLAHRRELALDVGSGSGQAALPLAERFGRVVATDASGSQLRHAPGALSRLVCLAERLPLRDGSADLITVAQALHWLDVERFGAEARRVLRPGGILAAWTYRWFRMEPPFAEAVTRFHERVAPCWPPERALVEAGYATLPLPGEPVPVPLLAMRDHWPLAAVAGYLRTWSATKRFSARHGEDPVVEFERDAGGMDAVGPDGLAVEWDLVVRVMRV